MEYIAISKNIKISPRKMRLVVDGVKKQSLKNAVASLVVMNKRAALPVKKTIDSAVANAVNNFSVAKDTLEIKDIIVSEGVVLKRFHFAARGRVRPYKRRQSHVRVILTDGQAKAAVKVPVQAAKTDDKSLKTEVKKEKTEKTKKGEAK